MRPYTSHRCSRSTVIWTSASLSARHPLLRDGSEAALSVDQAIDGLDHARGVLHIQVEQAQATYFRAVEAAGLDSFADVPEIEANPALLPLLRACRTLEWAEGEALHYRNVIALARAGGAAPRPSKVVVNVPSGWERPKDASKSGWAENYGHWDGAWKKRLTGVDPSKSNGYTWLGGFVDRGEVEMTVADIVVQNVSAGPTRGSQVDRLGSFRVSAEGRLDPLDREGNPSDEAHYFAWRTAIHTVRAHARKLLAGGST